MTPEALADLVRRKESETLEFKKSTSELTRGMQAGCGMLTTRGGRILFGVDDRGKIIGQPTGTTTLLDIANEAKRFDPPVVPELEAVDMGNRKCVLAGC